jgi:hypothetical protein
VPTGGKTTAHTGTYRGRFVERVPNKRVVEIDGAERTLWEVLQSITVVRLQEMPTNKNFAQIRTD